MYCICVLPQCEQAKLLKASAASLKVHLAHATSNQLESKLAVADSSATDMHQLKYKLGSS